MRKIIVAIDGYSSCGKSTMAKALAEYAGYRYVDTGAMYRATALAGLRKGIITDDEIDEEKLKVMVENLKIDFAIVEGKQHTTLNGEDVESEIRTLEVGNAASRVSTIGFVRVKLVELQQRMGDEKGIVMDGRDIGTVVFPKAELKIFVTAAAEIRAKRRFDELKAKGKEMKMDEVLADVIDRDHRDTHRKESPLRQAVDARILDNSELTREEQFETIKGWFNEARR